MQVNFGNIVPISTLDWRGRSACTVFLNGCNFRCPYCQNHKIVNMINWIDIDIVKKKISDSIGFISAVVFSGGEPTMQRNAILELARFVKDYKLNVGIETNGYYSDTITFLANKQLVDKIFLDIKAPPENNQKYMKITGGIIDANKKIMKSLKIKNVDIEARTTIFRSNVEDVLYIAKYLKEIGYCKYTIQQGAPENAPNKDLRKESRFTKNEMETIVKNVSSLVDIEVNIVEGKYIY